MAGWLGGWLTDQASSNIDNSDFLLFRGASSKDKYDSLVLWEGGWLPSWLAGWLAGWPSEFLIS